MQVIIDLINSLRSEAGLVTAVIAIMEVLKQLDIVDEHKEIAAVIVTYVVGIAAYAASVYLGLETWSGLPSVLVLLAFLSAVSQIVYDKIVNPIRKALR